MEERIEKEISVFVFSVADVFPELPPYETETLTTYLVAAEVKVL